MHNLEKVFEQTELPITGFSKNVKQWHIIMAYKNGIISGKRNGQK